MIAVAKSLGISQPVFFQRFGTRSKLVLEALLPHIRPTAVVALLERGPSEGAPLAEQLLAVAEALETFFDEATPCLMALALVGAFQTRAFARHLGIVPKRSSITYRIDVVDLFIRGLGEARTRS